jgi:hypothetical protein
MIYTEIPSMNAAKCTSNATPGINIVIKFATRNVAQSISDTFHRMIFKPMYPYMTVLNPIVGVMVKNMAKIARTNAKAMSLGLGRISHRAIALQNQWKMFE